MPPRSARSWPGTGGLLEATDTESLARTVQQVGALAADLHDVLVAADFNPVFVRPSGEVRIVDALLIAAGAQHT